LLDAFAIKNMVAFGLNGVLCDITAESTDGSFADLVRAQKLLCVSFAAKHKIWVASHLSHAGEPAGTLESSKVRTQKAYKLNILE